MIVFCYIKELYTFVYHEFLFSIKPLYKHSNKVSINLSDYSKKHILKKVCAKHHSLY